VARIDANIESEARADARTWTNARPTHVPCHSPFAVALETGVPLGAIGVMLNAEKLVPSILSPRTGPWP
jgi:hypothetical protein